MKILIAGSTGFMGTALTRYIQSKGIEVVGYSKSLGRDVLNTNLLSQFVNEASLVINCVINIGNRVSTDLILENLATSYSIFQACLSANKPLIHISSCEAYGDSQYEPMDENHPLEPHNAYALSKVFSDRILLYMVERFHLDARIVRPFTSYGPSNKHKFQAIRNWYEKIKDNKPVIIYGDGSDYRDYLYVDDIAKGVWKCRNLKAGEIINLATGISTTNLELAGAMKKVMNSDAKIIFTDYPTTHPRLYKQRGSYTKAERLLGWKPEVELIEGLKRTISAYDNEIY